MPSKHLDRREFLRRAGLTAGTLSAGTLTGALSGCGEGDSPVDPRPPAAPSDFTATPVSATRIELGWSDNSSNETSFELQRHSSLESDFMTLVEPPAGSTGYSDESVSGNTLYYYRIRSVSEGLTSAWTDTAEAQSPGIDAPPTPTGFAVQSVTSGSVVLGWSGGDGSGFRLQQFQGAGWVTIQTLVGTATTATVAGLAADALHRFRLVAFNGNGESIPAAAVEAFTGAPVADLTATPVEPGRVRLAWTDRTGGAVTLRVQRRSGAGDFVSIGTPAAGATTFDDAGVPPGAALTWRVEPQNLAAMPGAETLRKVPATPPAAPTTPQAARLDVDGSRLRFTWAPPTSADQEGYGVERRPGTSSFSAVHTGTDPAEGHYEETPDVPFVAVTFRARAWNLAGWSPYSGTASATPRAVFPLTGTLAVLQTVGRGASVSINRPSMSLGSTCNSPRANLYLIRVSESQITAVVAHCTHQCLTVPSFHWVESAGHFECAHGSQFDATGALLQGPAPTSVPSLPTELFADRVEVLPPVTSIG